ncbi:MAG: polyketide synthase dehydratase domain-containing protein [Phycisphaerales bacterium]|jgi:3-hydroxyacyl-[acyl-carrier-protein] dehydratase|nr:polyketide synthase dehydratase domain-containing protein [Phycisphaerales bacterium]
MKFDLVDQVLEQEDGRIVTIKQISPDEEYLADHFPSFPIMPGVLMLEAMVQAASQLLALEGQRLVLGDVRAVKYGAMVRPGDALKVEVTASATKDDGTTLCKGTGTVLRRDSNKTMTAVAGRFTMRPARIE